MWRLPWREHIKTCKKTTRPGSTNGLTHIRTTPSEINIPKDPRRSRASRCLRKTSGRLDRKEHRHPRGSRGEADDALRHQAACEVKGTTTDSQTPPKQVRDQKTFPELLFSIKINHKLHPNRPTINKTSPKTIFSHQNQHNLIVNHICLMDST